MDVGKVVGLAGPNVGRALEGKDSLELGAVVGLSKGGFGVGLEWKVILRVGDLLACVGEHAVCACIWAISGSNINDQVFAD